MNVDVPEAIAALLKSKPKRIRIEPSTTIPEASEVTVSWPANEAKDADV